MKIKHKISQITIFYRNIKLLEESKNGKASIETGLEIKILVSVSKIWFRFRSWQRQRRQRRHTLNRAYSDDVCGAGTCSGRCSSHRSRLLWSLPRGTTWGFRTSPLRTYSLLWQLCEPDGWLLSTAVPVVPYTNMAVVMRIFIRAYACSLNTYTYCAPRTVTLR